MSTFYIDHDLGDDYADGSFLHPWKNHPSWLNWGGVPFTRSPDDEFRFARGSSWTIANQWVEKVPCVVTAYDRAGENSSPAPLLQGIVGAQYILSFIGTYADVTWLEIVGGTSGSVRFSAKDGTVVDSPSIQRCVIRPFGGDGIKFDCKAADGKIVNATAFHNEVVRDIQSIEGGDGIVFGAGISYSEMGYNVVRDMGHGCLQIYSGPGTGPATTHHNYAHHNVLDGANSAHCRGWTVTSQRGQCFSNIFEKNISTNMTAKAHLCGINNRAVDEEIYGTQDIGLNFYVANDVESWGCQIEGGVIEGCLGAGIQLLARHGLTVAGFVANKVSLRNNGIQSNGEDIDLSIVGDGGKILGYQFNDVSMCGTVKLYDDLLTIEEANELTGFNLIDTPG